MKPLPHPDNQHLKAAEGWLMVERLAEKGPNPGQSAQPKRDKS